MDYILFSISSREDKIFSYDGIANGNLWYKTKRYQMITCAMCNGKSYIIGHFIVSFIVNW